MSADLTRVSISLEESLLEQFDDYLHSCGYGTRSEAIRDLIRQKLTAPGEGDDRVRVGVLSCIADASTAKKQSTVGGWASRAGDLLVSTLQAPFADDHLLVVMVLRGGGTRIRRFAEGVLSVKGVLHGDLHLTGPEDDVQHWTRSPADSDEADAPAPTLAE